MITHTAQSPITLSWPGDWTLSVEVEGARLCWEVVLAEPPIARAMHAAAAGLSGRLRRTGCLLRALAPVAGRLLGVGPLAMTGSMPNGQMFSMTPYRVWVASGRG